MTAPMAPPGWTRVYRRRDRVAHLREDVAPAELIACRKITRGHDMWPTYDADHWYGTGSQAEYERAAGLPLCPDCAKAVGL